MPNTLVRRPWCFHCFCFFYFQMWWEFLFCAFFPNVNGIVSSSDIFFPFRGSSCSLQMGFWGWGSLTNSIVDTGAWLHVANCCGLKCPKLPWIYLLFSDAWVVLTLDVYLREPEKTPEMQRICLKTAVSFQAPPPLPNPATWQPNAIDSEPSCLLVAPLVLFLNAVCFSNSCASASINI